MNDEIGRFESLGDNCEFAFYLRSSGMDVGSLFRWTLIKNYWSLLKLLETDFQCLYEFENLQPSWQDMVIDTKFDLGFHTKMYSELIDEKWVWTKTQSELSEIYAEEKGKINYLIKKFKLSLANKDKIFIIKNNENNLDDFALALSKEIIKYGDAKLIYVKSDDVTYNKGIERITENLYVTYIDRFAEYHKADDLSKNGWDNVIKEALQVL
ncbi:hypothetical protein SAMN05216522_101208 [Rosenbergiella nectarea]|uniref:Papain-like cysteine peptidase n=1 Tax=Rosenbergiella nectarea TaxID=988801 RepID=A0A1H9DCK1_9GAMM|nr:hypothetical protein [Rosenbergiella nectarea]SEQ10458.1 hypothetical protein SAMN05216522_101208 [Rosenbergiella nectarea]